jgi:hypothetical protein
LAEQPQKVPNVDGARMSVNNRGMPPWRSRSRSSIESAPADHARDDGGGLRGGVDATLRRDLHMLAQQSGQPAPAGQRHDRDQPGARHEIRIVERCGDRAVGVG